MANPTNAAPAAPTAPAAAETPKVKKQPLQSVYPTAEAAIAEATSRTKGPRRAFSTTLNGKVVYVVANNEGRAGGVAFMQAGGVVEELGKAGKKPKTLGVDGIMAAVNSLPEAERAAVLAQLKSLSAPKK